MVIMKSLLLLSTPILLLSILQCGYGGVDCRDIGGEEPVPILNSPYTILPNGSLCCPEFAGDFCQDEKEVATKCRGGLVYEPCHFCKTCAKIAGDECGGTQGQNGYCDDGLECAVINETALTGRCYGKADKRVGETCGGSYGVKGRCLPGLRCNVSEEKFLEEGDDIQGVCLNESTVPGACFKNCVNRDRVQVCGNDGRWYRNKCELKKQNCVIPKDRHPHKIKKSPSSTICEQGCGDVELLQSWNAKVSSYSNEVVDGSIATVVCEDGYDLIGGKEKLTLRCADQQWREVIIDENGQESDLMRETWRILCYPSRPGDSSSSSE